MIVWCGQSPSRYAHIFHFCLHYANINTLLQAHEAETIVLNICQQILHNPNAPSLHGIRSVSYPNSLSGRLYVEAPNPASIVAGLKNYTVVRMTSLSPVDASEVQQVLRMNTHTPTPLDALRENPRCWVRIRVGLYQGDLGWTLDIESDNKITVAVIPRLRHHDEKGKGTKRKRTATTRGQRPEPRLFDSQDWPERLVETKKPGSHVYRGQFFRGGYLELKIHPRDVIVWDLRPMAEEIQFLESNGAFDEYREEKDYSLVDLLRTKNEQATLAIDDRVLVCAGEQKGLIGIIMDINWGTVELEVIAGGSGSVTVNREDVVRTFRIGDYVIVSGGTHAGAKGWIIGLNAPWVTVCVDDTTFGEVSTCS